MSWRAAIGRQLKEVKICLAVTGDGTSTGARAWVMRRTNEIKMLNPNFPLFIREGDGIDPIMYVYRDWGEQVVVDLSNKTEKEVDDSLKQVVEDAISDTDYQSRREPCPYTWLRRPTDVIDEIGRNTPRIDLVLPSNNLFSEAEKQAARERLERSLDQQVAAIEKEAERLERKANRKFTSS